jgi:hypothetical protein
MGKITRLVLLMLAVLMMLVSICQAMGSINRDEKNPKNEEQAVTTERFVQIYKDDESTYYLDNATAKKIKHPYLKEDLLDVWLKVEGNANGVYSDPVSYAMKHYYVRLTEKQVQLINSVDFNGETPVYTPDEPYREKNWRTLVPSSPEESCYLKVIELVK